MNFQGQILRGYVIYFLLIKKNYQENRFKKSNPVKHLIMFRNYVRPKVDGTFEKF